VRSLIATLGSNQPAAAALVAAAPAPPSVLLRGERARRNAFWARLRFDRPAPGGMGLAFTALLLLAVFVAGAWRGGQFRIFVAENGSIGDFVARELGFAIRAVTISGYADLHESDVLALAGISPKESLPFFDAAAARARLEAAPLVKQASVRKLYPGQIVIDIVERTPAAVWQKDGQVKAIAADGAVIDELRDTRSLDLPFVVGEGANERLAEFLSLLDAAQELRPKIYAGVLVGGRRWNLRMKSGLDVKLPETDPLAAITTLVALQRQSRILERDVLWLDLRTEGRVFARLSADAAAARAAARAKKGAAP
jgi:cell division protein FtsQ